MYPRISCILLTIFPISVWRPSLCHQDTSKAFSKIGIPSSSTISAVLFLGNMLFRPPSLIQLLSALLRSQMDWFGSWKTSACDAPLVGSMDLKTESWHPRTARIQETLRLASPTNFSLFDVSANVSLRMIKGQVESFQCVSECFRWFHTWMNATKVLPVGQSCISSLWQIRRKQRPSRVTCSSGSWKTVPSTMAPCAQPYISIPFILTRLVQTICLAHRCSNSEAVAVESCTSKT